MASWSAVECGQPDQGVSSVASRRIGNLPINTADVAARPNTVINLVGLRVVLNEQIPFTTPDGATG